MKSQPMLTTLLSIAVQSIILSCFVSRLAVSPIMAPAYAHQRLWKRIRSMPVATIWLWMSFFGSWCFVVAVDVLQHGANLTDTGACTASIFVCISLYCVSKAAIYMFLTERAHVVRGGTRREDKIYWLNLSLVLGIVALWILCHVFRVVQLKEDRCIISIAREVDIPFIIYDFFINIFLTIQFLIPLLKSSSLKGRFKRFFSRGRPARLHEADVESQYLNEAERQLYTLASRTFVGGLFCTLVTIANGIQVALMFGKEDAWLCLATCSGDVVLNCIILHFCTNGRQGTDESVHRANASLESANNTRPRLELRTSSMVIQKALIEGEARQCKVAVLERTSSSQSPQLGGIVYDIEEV